MTTESDSKTTSERAKELLSRAFEDPRRDPKQTAKLVVHELIEADEPLSKRELAREVGRSPRQLTRVVRELEEGGVIEREYRAGVRPAHWFTVAEE